jgi:hypothetical protein
LELGVVGAATVAIMEVCKRKFPYVFTSDVNALLTVVVFTLLNVGNAWYFGGDMRSAVGAGIVIGLATTGLYRTVSGLSKKNAVDLSEQVNANEIAGRIVGDNGEGGEDTKQIGFTTK